MLCKFGYYESFRDDIDGGVVRWRGVVMPMPKKDWIPDNYGYSWDFANSESEIIKKLHKGVRDMLADCVSALNSLD